MLVPSITTPPIRIVPNLIAPLIGLALVLATPPIALTPILTTRLVDLVPNLTAQPIKFSTYFWHHPLHWSCAWTFGSPDHNSIFLYFVHHIVQRHSPTVVCSFCICAIRYLLSVFLRHNMGIALPGYPPTGTRHTQVPAYVILRVLLPGKAFERLRRVLPG